MKYLKAAHFTMIELLTVFSVLLILASLLQPSFSKMLNQAQTVECLGNLSKVSSALSMYIDDSNGLYPNIRSPYHLMGKIGKLRGLYKNKALNPYLGHNYEAAHCPADKGDISYFGGREIKVLSTFDSFGSSYLPARYTVGGVRALFSFSNPVSVNSIDQTQNKFVMADWPWGIWRDAKDLETRRHGGDVSRMLNILFADGHAALTDFTIDYEINRFTMRPNKNWLFW